MKKTTQIQFDPEEIVITQQEYNDDTYYCQFCKTRVRWYDDTGHCDCRYDNNWQVVERLVVIKQD